MATANTTEQRPQALGIYVESLIHAPIDRVWALTQEPAVHQRWDLRFDRIDYLPRPDPAQPQQFVYETSLGFGLKVCGTGETAGQRGQGDAETTSALKFASADCKSLISTGSGYWRYLPLDENTTRFLTWYDYQVRFGAAGRLFDRLIFRPLIGWATAWSFDRLRLWAEDGQTPESSRDLALIHAAARLMLATIWLWHGLVPKLIFNDHDERAMLTDAGASTRWLPAFGLAEVALGLAHLVLWRRRSLLLASAALMLPATIGVAQTSPRYFKRAFNPLTLNLSVVALGLIGWWASRAIPSAANCKRTLEPR